MANAIDSAVLIGLDTLPLQIGTAGEGFKGDRMHNNDFVSIPVNNAQFDSYRLVRFPTNAHIKRVWSFGVGIDNNAAATAAFDINVAFSDSAFDSTPLSLQGLIPVAGFTGLVSGFTPGTGYINGTPNRMFGAATKLNGNVSAKLSLDLTYTNTFTPAFSMLPLWNVFGFVNAQGIPQDPGGMFDIFLTETAGPATAATGTVSIEVDFVL